MMLEAGFISIFGIENRLPTPSGRFNPIELPDFRVGWPQSCQRRRWLQASSLINKRNFKKRISNVVSRKEGILTLFIKKTERHVLQRLRCASATTKISPFFKGGRGDF